MTESSAQKRIKAAELLAQGMAPISVAKELGVTAGTIYRWRKDEGFLRRPSDWIEKQVDEARLTVSSELLPRAVSILNELLDSENDSARLNASKLIMQIHGINRAMPTEEVSMDDAVYEAATKLLAELFFEREDLRKEALVELARRRKDRGKLGPIG